MHFCLTILFAAGLIAGGSTHAQVPTTSSSVWTTEWETLKTEWGSEFDALLGDIHHSRFDKAVTKVETFQRLLAKLNYLAQATSGTRATATKAALERVILEETGKSIARLNFTDKNDQSKLQFFLAGLYSVAQDQKALNKVLSPEIKRARWISFWSTVIPTAVSTAGTWFSVGNQLYNWRHMRFFHHVGSQTPTVTTLSAVAFIGTLLVLHGHKPLRWRRPREVTNQNLVAPILADCSKNLTKFIY